MADRNQKLTADLWTGQWCRFAEIVRRYDRAVKQFVAWYIQDSDTREDIVQETFYKAFLAFDSVAAPERMESWLKTIARRAIVDQLRKRRRLNGAHRRGSPFEQQASERTTHANVADTAWVWSEVDALEPIYADVLRLRYAECLTYAEIAERLRLPESTVRGRLFEARKLLRRRIEAKGLYP